MVAAALLGLPGFVLAQATLVDAWRSAPASARIGYETITLPGDERMGMVGMAYLVEARPGLCLGPAVYGAASGQRGGFFTIGAEAALCTRLYGPLSLQAGLYMGGGGGAATAVGGGLMLRPYANLLWDFGAFNAGVSVSNVRFPNGDIESSQFGVVLDVPLSFTTLPLGGAKPKRYIGTPTGLGFDRVLAVAGVYGPRGGSLGTSGAPLPSKIGYVGARAETFLRYHVYAGVEANGAASGGVDGYAEILGTLGTEYLLGDSGITLGARVALGMGGGGDVPTGGGLLGKAALDLGIALTRDLSLGLEAGWAGAPLGDFSAPFGSLSLRWALDPLLGVPPTVVREEWAAGVELYQDAARKNGSSGSLQNVTFKYTRFLGETVYLTGQVQSAYQGAAGAYLGGPVRRRRAVALRFRVAGRCRDAGRRGRRRRRRYGRRCHRQADGLRRYGVVAGAVVAPGGRLGEGRQRRTQQRRRRPDGGLRLRRGRPALTPADNAVPSFEQGDGMDTSHPMNRRCDVRQARRIPLSKEKGEAVGVGPRVARHRVPKWSSE